MKTSIIIASNGFGNSIGPCIKALYSQSDDDVLQVILCANDDPQILHKLIERFPKLELIQFEQPTNLPTLRQAGIEKAQGDIVVILDPYAIVQEHWLKELHRTHVEQPNLAIGGGVSPFATDELNLFKWAIYINEYGGFFPPLSEGVVSILPGCNISYKRSAWQLSPMESPAPGFWKAFFNLYLEDQGFPLWLHPEMKVHLFKPIPFREFLRSRFLHGRCFAGMRSHGMSLPERLLRSISAPLLPFIFLFRLGRVFMPKSDYRRKFILTVPLQFLLFTNWSLGELVGYLAGSGESCECLYY